jgi:hypothetical protein
MRIISGRLSTVKDELIINLNRDRHLIIVGRRKRSTVIVLELCSKTPVVRKGAV